MIAVVDANIAISLMLDLAYSDRARQAIAGARSMIAPDLIIHETANTLWKIATAQPGLIRQCNDILRKMPLLFDQIADGRSLAQDAYALAISLKHPAYDCFYIALAQQRGATLVTADKRLGSVISNSKTLEVKHLQV